MTKRIQLIIIIITSTLIAAGLTTFFIFGRKNFSGENTPVSNTSDITLEYWGLHIPQQVMAVLIDDYKKIRPSIKIRYTQKRFSDLHRYKKTLLNQLEGGTGPDIFRAHSTWIPEYFTELSGINPMSKATFNDTFYSVAVSECVGTEKVYCIPIMYDGLALIYNKDMFDEEGLSTPVTWDDVRDSALILARRDKSNLTRGGIALGTPYNVTNSTDILALMMAQSDVKIPDDLDSEAAQSAIRFYTDFATRYKVWDASMPNSLIAFATEDLAMVFATSAQLLDILELNPTMNLGVLTVPQVPTLSGQTTKDSWATFWVETVSADAKDQSQLAAWQFLQWLSQPEQQIKLFNEFSSYRRYGEIYGNKELGVSLKNFSQLGSFIIQAPNATTSVITDSAGNNEQVDVLKKAIQTVYEKEDPREALKNAMIELKKLPQ